jgi:hypothetical protein
MNAVDRQTSRSEFEFGWRGAFHNGRFVIMDQTCSQIFIPYGNFSIKNRDPSRCFQEYAYNFKDIIAVSCSCNEVGRPDWTKVIAAKSAITNRPLWSSVHHPNSNSDRPAAILVTCPIYYCWGVRLPLWEDGVLRPHLVSFVIGFSLCFFYFIMTPIVSAPYLRCGSVTTSLSLYHHLGYDWGYVFYLTYHTGHALTYIYYLQTHCIVDR